MANRRGKGGNSDRFPLLGLQKSLRTVTTARKVDDCRKAMTNLDNVLKNRDILCPQRYVWSRLWFSQWSRTVVRAGP